MKSLRLITGFVFATLLVSNVVFISNTLAQPTPTINYQGKLTDPTGLAVADGPYAMEFRLYTAVTGGTLLWTETLTGANEVSVVNGLFSIMLGSTTPLSSVDFNQPLFLSINVEGDGEMVPRKPFGTVPAAFEAQRVGGVASTSFLRSDQADTASGLLTFTGGLISSASSSITNLTSQTATTTNLVINGENFTDLTGTGLTNTGGVLTVSTSTLGLFGTTSIDTSAKLAAILGDETGTGNVVFSVSPTFTGTPVLPGAFTIGANTFTRTGAHNLTFTTTAATTLTLPTSGTLYGTAASSITSAQLLSSITNETGTGNVVFSTTPTFTTSIIAPLVNGGTAVGSTLTLRSTTGVGTTDAIIFGVGNNGATEAMRVVNSGFVGIGTTTPSQRLTIAGGVRITGALVDNASSTGSNGSVLQSTGTGFNWVATSTLGFSSSFTNSAQLAALLSDETGTGFSVFSDSPTFTGTVNAAAATLSSTLTMSGTVANIALGSNWLSGDGGDEGVFVTAGGGVGVGTSTPQRKFTVIDNQAVVATFISTNGSFTGVDIDNISSGDTAMRFLSNGNPQIIQGYRAATDTFSIDTGSSFDDSPFFAIERLSGEVGIGTSSPTSQLHVVGTGNTARGVSIQNTTNGTVAAAELRLAAGAGGSGDFFIREYSSLSTLTNVMNGFSVENDAAIYTGNELFLGAQNIYLGTNASASGLSSTPALSLLSSGNVGIGTTSPPGTLTIQDSKARALAVFDDTGNEVFTVQTDLGNQDRAKINVTNNQIRFDHGNVAGPDLFMGVETSGNLDAFIYSTQSSRNLNIGAGGNTNILTISGGGNVGIGTSTPSQRLTVAGNVRITGALFDSNNASGTTGQVLQSTGTGFNWVATSTLGISGGGGGDFFADGSVDMTDTLFLAQGALGTGGISFAGDTDTGIESELAGEIRLVANGVPSIFLNEFEVGFFDVSTFIDPGGVNSVAFKSFGTSTESAPQFNFGGSGMFSSDYGLIGFSTNGTERLTIGASGNVGIGTTTPEGLLHIHKNTGQVDFILSTNDNVGVGNVAQLLFISDADGTPDSASIGQSLNANLSFSAVGNLIAPDLTILNSNGFVGIGTTTPSQRLTVAGGVRITGALVDNASSTGSNGMVLQSTGSGFNWVATSTLGFGSGDFLANGSVAMTGAFRAATGTVSAPSITFAADTDTGFYRTSGALVATVDGAIAAQFLSGGGISTAGADITNLYVQGGDFEVYGGADLRFDLPGSFIDGSFKITPGKLGGAVTPVYSFSGDTDTGMFSTSTDILGFATAGTERLRIDASGNIGIGTTSPSEALTVAGGGLFTDTLFLAQGALGTGGLSFVGDADTGITAESSNVISVRAGGTEMLVIDSSGVNFGDGSLYYNNTSGIIEAFRYTTDSAGSPTNVDFGVDLDADNGMFSAANNQLGFSTAATERLRINASGLVGIGTTTPSQRLTVAGGVRITGALVDNASSTGSNGMVLQSTGSGFNWVATSTLGISGGASLFTDGGANTYLTSLTDNLSIGGTGGTSRLNVFADAADFAAAILNDGNNANRSGLLIQGGLDNIATAGPSTLIQFNDGDGGDVGSIGFGNNGFKINSGSTADLVIADNGNDLRVGVGGITGVYIQGLEFDVTSDQINLTSLNYNITDLFGIRMMDGSTSSPSFSFSGDTNTGMFRGGTDILGFSTAGTERLRIDASGNVGIGTTTPSQLLTVAGNANVTGTLSGVTGDFTGEFNFGGAAYISSVGLARLSTSLANAPAFSFENDTDTGMFGGTNTLGFSVGGTSRMLIDSSGNIGIGTTTLSSRLTVAGDINLTTGSIVRYNGDGLLSANDVNYNVAFGLNEFNDMHSGVTGSNNAFFGISAGGSVTSGDGNVLFGKSAGFSLTTESNNTYIGTDAGVFASTGDFNIALGTSALRDTLADYTIAIGQSAGTDSEGTENIFIGNFAGAGVTGNNNIFLGDNTGSNTSTGSNNILIGDNIELPTSGTSNFLSLGNALYGNLTTGNIGLGTTSPSSRLALQVDSLTGTGTAALQQWITTTNSSNGALQYGNFFNLDANNTATTTIIGSIFRVEDDTIFGNTVRGLEIQTNRGSNTQGENTAISGTGRTFGVRGITEGDAGGVLAPAGGFFQTRGTTQGNAIRGFSSSITSATLMSLFQDTSTFTGTGLELNFGNSGGSFSSTTSRFVDFRNTNTSVFNVTAYGTTTIGDGTNMAGLQIGRGGICVDNDGACIASVQGRIASVSQFTGNSDLAEMYFSSQSLETGEIVSLDGELSVVRADEGTDPIIGVVSTKPGVLMGADDESTRAGETAYPIALSGRVPIQLSTENGPIKKGDQLTLSSLPGVAMKATATGTVVGIALEDFDSSRKYSRTFINQFGDDLVDPVYQPITDPNDPRVHDGCYYGGGADNGSPCVPLNGESMIEQINSANQVLADQSVAEQLAGLAGTPSETRDVNGQSVQVGQIVMFVDLSYRFIGETQAASLASLMSTSSVQTVGENIDETLFDRLVSLAQGFVDGILQVAGIKTNRIEVKEELCVDGVCIDANDLRQLLDNNNIDGTPAPVQPEPTPESEPPNPPAEPTDEESVDETSGGGGQSGEGGPPEPSVEPPVEPVVPEPEPTPEPLPEPEPEPEPELTPEPEPLPTPSEPTS